MKLTEFTVEFELRWEVHLLI